jgi:hypothetical protein
MGQLMELLKTFEKEAKDARDGQPGEVSQDTWHFYNGKLSAVHDMQARLELYTETWGEFEESAAANHAEQAEETPKREIELTEWLRFADGDGKRTWVHPDDVPDFERQSGDGGCLYVRLNTNKVEKEAEVRPAPSRVTMRYKLDPPVELSLCSYDELFVVWSDMHSCSFLVAYGETPEGDPDELRISVNLFSEATPHGCFFCRDEDYKEQFVAELIERQILMPTGRRDNSGHITIPMFRFSPMLEPSKI